MPELPEVETIVRSVARHVVGRIIRHALFSSRFVTRAGFTETANALTGALIEGVRRRGKQIFFDLDRGTLYVHLGMTGKLLWNAPAGKHARAILEFDHGTLIYDDPRQFGRVEFFETLPQAFSKTGPDALEIAFEEFYARLKKHRGQIKPLLLNQSLLSGIGNIYADEMLFAARIHPRAIVSRISKKRAESLYASLLEVLHLAIEHRGSSISDYVDSAGRAGGYQNLHNVYGKEGTPCPRCGAAIRKIVLAQRGTHYCPRCQRV